MKSIYDIASQTTPEGSTCCSCKCDMFVIPLALPHALPYLAAPHRVTGSTWRAFVYFRGKSTFLRLKHQSPTVTSTNLPILTSRLLRVNAKSPSSERAVTTAAARFDDDPHGCAVETRPDRRRMHRSGPACLVLGPCAVSLPSPSAPQGPSCLLCGDASTEKTNSGIAASSRCVAGVMTPHEAGVGVPAADFEGSGPTAWVWE